MGCCEKFGNGLDMLNGDGSSFNTVGNEMVINFDIFSFGMKYEIVNNCNGGNIVTE